MKSRHLLSLCISLSCSQALASPNANKPITVENKDPLIEGFVNIGTTLGDRATTNNIGIEKTKNGVVLFDANNDGLIDIFIPHSGQPVVRKVDDEGALMPDTLIEAKPCTLFLNQGNDENGEPIFVSIQELQEQNLKKDKKAKFLKEELLIENKYVPRTSLKDDEFSIGRYSYGAVPGDFNGDGLIDLYVLSDHRGVSFQIEEFGLRIHKASNQLGRKDSNTKVTVVTSPAFLDSDHTDDLNKKVNFSGKEEWAGRNTLFINLGDRDNDGIPEWKDVTDEANAGGKWSSISAAVADVDRDGDLDIYVSNFLDKDFLGFNTRAFPGNRNQLYLNQLSETGKMTFSHAAIPMGVSGLYKEEGIDHGVWDPGYQKVIKTGYYEYKGKQIGEVADHSILALFSDWTHDGYPDIMVSNDAFNPLRVYHNQQGLRFDRDKRFDAHSWNGSWMGLPIGDLNGDMKPDIFAVNFGTKQLTKKSFVLPKDLKDVSLGNLTMASYPNDARLHHELFTYKDGPGIDSVTDKTFIYHDPVIPPEATRKVNISESLHQTYDHYNFANSITGLEFGWGAMFFDVENDGDLDIYLSGGLARGLSPAGTLNNPGRLLRNIGKPGAENYTFEDRTVEYRLLDITDVDYDHQPIRRKAPSTGWHKRDFVYINDFDTYKEIGLNAARNTRQYDFFGMTEAAQGMAAADLNNDGFEDLVVTHKGGYDSLSTTTAKNLKIRHNGQLMALPSKQRVGRAPTNFEPGPTFVYINRESKREKPANWVKIKLRDPKSHNKFAVGARIIVNDKLLRYSQVGGQAVASAHLTDFTVGLGTQNLKKLEIYWPSGELKPHTFTFDSDIANSEVCIDRGKGIANCDA